MLPTLILVMAALLLRGAGALGIQSLADWRSAARWALSLMLLFTASAHFAPIVRPDLVAMVPPSLPHAALLVSVTGVLEIVLAAAIQIPATRRAAGIALIAMLILVFPANVSAAARHVPLGGRPATPLGLRVPMQILFVAVAWWTTHALGSAGGTARETC